MAQKVQIHLEDNLDGGPADEAITFALKGLDCEILTTTSTEWPTH